MTHETTLNGTDYRYQIEDRPAAEQWTRLQAYYFNIDRNEWRLVNNWNTRELLFIQHQQLAA